MENLIASFIGSFVLWTAATALILGFLELIPLLRIFPRLKYFGGMGLVCALAFGTISNGYIKQSVLDLCFMLVVFALGWWYAFDGVKDGIAKLKALENRDRDSC